MATKHFIQVGITALRNPMGKHYCAVPLYIEIDRLNESGLAPCEEKSLHDFAGLAIEEYGKKLSAEKGNESMSSIKEIKNRSVLNG